MFFINILIFLFIDIVSDLVFSFVDELLPDQTPESVHLMPQDEIWVEHRKKPECEPEQPLLDKKFYSDHFKILLDQGLHSDVTFTLDGGSQSIKSHKAILSARSEYFMAMFHEGGMCESFQNEIKVSHNPVSFKRMLEFIYTNCVHDLEICSSEDVVSLLILANEYVLDDLRMLCEKRAAKMISVDNISQLFLLSAGHNASVLRDACGGFVEDNKAALVKDPTFRQEIERNPELGLLLFECSVPKVHTVGDDTASGKKRRRGENGAGSEDDESSHNTNTIAQSNVNVQD